MKIKTKRKTAQKFPAALIVVALFTGLLPLAGTKVRAETITDATGNYQYAIREDGTAILWDYLGTESEVIIPSEVDGYPVTVIGMDLFTRNYIYYTSTAVSRVVIPSTVVELDDCAFYYAKKLKTVEIPDSVVKIGYHVFEDCTSLQSISIPASVTEIGRMPFKGAEKLQRIEVAEENPAYTSVDGALYDKEKKKLLAVPAQMKLAPQDTPKSVTVIGTEAFYENAYLTNAVIPNRIKKIKYEAFRGCRKLKKIIIGTGIKRIEERAFIYCSAKKVVFRGKIKTIAAYTFCGCWKLSSINLPKGLEGIYDEAFECCSSLSTIKLPNSLKTIYYNAFFGCEKLKTITIPKSVKEMDGCGLGIDDGETIYEDDIRVGICIRGYAGSAAQKYARKNKLKFKDIKTGKVTRYDLKKVDQEKVTKVTTGKGKLTVRYRKQEKVSYRVAVRKEGTKKYTVFQTAQTTCTIRKLKRGKTYQVKVCAVREYGGKRYRGRWSRVREVMVK